MSLVLGFSFWLTFRAQFHVEARKSDRSYSLKSSLIWGAKSLPGLKFGSAPGVAEWLRRGSAERAWPPLKGW